MFDFREYYSKENAVAEASYQAGLLKIRDIVAGTNGIEGNGDTAVFSKFFNITGRFILKASEYEKCLKESYFRTAGFDRLKDENNGLFCELHPDFYGRSYANPSFAVSQLGDRLGQELSCFYVQVRQQIRYAFQHKVFKSEELNRAFIDLHEVMTERGRDMDSVHRIVIRDPGNPTVRDYVDDLRQNFSVEYGFLPDIVLESDLDDLRYLFRYGCFVSDADVQTARFIRAYPEDKIRKLSKQIAKAYRTGFQRDNKDMSHKSTVRFSYPVGYERILRCLIEDMLDMGLEPVIGAVVSQNPNRQYGYDHKFDAALYLDQCYVGRFTECYAEACRYLEGMLRAHSGTVLLETFGEEPFIPVKKKEPLQFSEEHHRLIQQCRNHRMEIVERYMPRSETSYTMIAFPSPDTGKDFAKIFDDIFDVNMLDVEKYERLQQRLIDELDKAEHVHIKGKGGNRTDINVRMHPLLDRATQTNFVNCGADVNIPVGEVFTSPVLHGTNGILHVEKTFLNGLRFDNLELTFRDGYIVAYSCSNYDNENDNKKYIEDNLLFPHKSLPVGEFAIGTNTLAYAVSKRYDILGILPILIIEKMGPHFAIGDTCFRHEEDHSVYNHLDGKEIIARENEKSSQRKEKPDEAYTYCHTDITIPYEAIDRISVVTQDGETIDIIRNGKFVVQGTEELNAPLE